MIKKILIKTKNEFFSLPRSWVNVIWVGIGIFIIMTLGLILIPQPDYNDGFQTLEALQEYASGLDEWIKMDGKNLANPSYESYYQKYFRSSIVKQIYEKIIFLFSYFGLKKSPTFSISFFKSILKEVTEQRKLYGWVDDFIQKIEIKDFSKLIIFGATQGAFHSLIRNFEKLKELNIIDENLKLTNQDFYIVFLGNAINRSPFTLETFTFLLKLMHQNPNNVIYLRGTNETHDAWKGLTLRRELELRAQDLSKEVIPLETEVNEFFNSLPLSIYCTTQLTQEEAPSYFQLLPSMDDEKLRNKLIEPASMDFLEVDSQDRLTSFKLSKLNDLPSDSKNKKPVLKAIVCDIKKRINYEQTDGLRLLPPINGVIIWNPLSAPIESVRIGLNFYQDAFVIIHPSQKNKNFLITLYNRDIRNEKSLNFNTRSYLLFSGELVDTSYDR